MKSSSMVSDKKLTNAVGGKSARACDNCIKRRARWYCAADDAFLCQSCDSSVHSANPLARRHERVRLKTSSLNSFDDLQISIPSWHQGFTRKARTPRQKRHGKFPRVSLPCLDLVPEIGSEEYSHEENDEQLLYRVPIFDPFVEELCNSANSKHEAVEKDFLGGDNGQNFGDEPKATSYGLTQETSNNLQGFLPSDMDLAEFAADVESLLGKGLEDESFDMEGLGILDSDYNKGKDCSNSFINERVKVEAEDAGEVTVCHKIRRTDVEIDLGRESFELNFDYDSQIPCEGEDCKEQVAAGDPIVMNNFELPKFGQDPRKTFLCLDYKGVLSSWDDNKSPWTTGERPDLNSGDFWIANLGINGGMPVYGDMGMMNNGGGAMAAMADGDREARVSRYREKRRTRLFAKKIRYEVRKLNAEKRPRMKGRFVKRASLTSSPATAASFPLLINNNSN